MNPRRCAIISVRKKGYITDVITQQGEGYVTAGRTKKMDNDVLNMNGGTVYDLRRA